MGRPTKIARPMSLLCLSLGAAVGCDGRIYCLPGVLALLGTRGPLGLLALCPRCSLRFLQRAVHLAAREERHVAGTLRVVAAQVAPCQADKCFAAPSFALEARGCCRKWLHLHGARAFEAFQMSLLCLDLVNMMATF